MPYLIKCNHCSVDIILDKISIMGQFNCPNCSNLNYQSEFTINNISKEEYRIRRKLSKDSYCPKCGSYLNTIAKYCSNCGAEPIKYIELTIFFCPRCNKEYQRDINFCEKDGTRLTSKTKNISVRVGKKSYLK